VREVVGAILGRVPRHSTIIELLDPFGRVRESSSAGDSEGGEATVLNVPVGWLGEGVNVSDKTGFEKFDHLFTVIQLLFVVRFLGSDVLLEVVGAGLRGDNQSIDNGSIGVGGEVVACDCTAD